MGYVYAYNYKNKKLLWAKNFKIPFSSNLKILKNSLFLVNQNNELYILNKKSGDLLKLIPTEETLIKNQFKNNLSANNDTLFYLNTYGSLYSIDEKTRKINFFINLNDSLDNSSVNTIFDGNQIINHKSTIVLTSNNYTYVIDSNTGTIIYKVNFSSKLKPIIAGDYIFLISKNNFLISFDKKKGKIIYSMDIYKEIAEYFKIKKEIVEFKHLMLVNNELNLFLENSYVLKFRLNGSLKNVTKIPSKKKSNPIIVDDSIMFLNNKNKIIILN